MIPLDPVNLAGNLPFLPDPARLLDPPLLIRVVVGIINHLLDGMKTVSDDAVLHYVLWTGNFSVPKECALPYTMREGHLVFPLDAPCRFIDNGVVTRLYWSCAAIANSAFGLIVVYAGLRSIWERGYRARYTLKAILPRLLLVGGLINFGLPLMQGAIDLNNAATRAFWSFDMGLKIDQPANIWSALVFVPVGDLLVGGLMLVTGIMFLVLSLAGIARGLMLVFLVGGSPLVFAAMLLPETRGYALAWRRLFVTTLFSQAIQVLVLRVALVLMVEDSSPLAALHGVLALYLVLKVPSALHASSKLESKVVSLAKHAEHFIQHSATIGSHAHLRPHPVAE